MSQEQAWDIVNEYTDIVAGMNNEIRELKLEIERLRSELEAARDALRNDFEPDNQSRAWHRANDALKAR